jgi:hypothetical protein
MTDLAESCIAVLGLVRAGARDFVLYEDFARLNAVIMREVIGDNSAACDKKAHPAAGAYPPA